MRDVDGFDDCYRTTSRRLLSYAYAVTGDGVTGDARRDLRIRYVSEADQPEEMTSTTVDLLAGVSSLDARRARLTGRQ